MSRQRTARRIRAAVAAAALAVSWGLVGAPAATAAVGERPTTALLADWSGSTGRGWGGGWSGSAGSPWSDQDPSGTGGADGSGVASTPATAAQSRGVVLIESALTYEGATGAGTGIVLTSSGQVLTNYHVVEGATRITVTVAATGTTCTAKVVGHSATSDVALLQLSGATKLTPATLDDDTLGTGDAVTAVGNAGGTGSLTAAAGTVTDLSTSITTSSEGSVAGEDLTGVIQTTADVVPGDSGGPLLDAEGEVVGIDTAASSGTTSADIDGYAIPIERALSVVRQIRSGTGTATVQVGAGAFLGVQVTDGTPDADASSGGATAGRGAMVVGVVGGSPAADAGLGAGDTITAIGGTTVGSAADLSAALARYDVGDRVVLSWTDSTGPASHASITLAASPTA